MLWELIFIVILGLLSGGLINVLADDLPYRRRPGWPAYPNGSPRPIGAWLGITAFLFGRRQPHPGAVKLGWRYPLTETATAALMTAAFLIMGRNPYAAGGQMLIWLMYMAIFILITVIDLEHRLIMRVCVAPAAGLALFEAARFPDPGPTLAGAMAGGGLAFAVFYLIYQGGRLFRHFIEKRRGDKIDDDVFGFGDVMLAGLSGLTLGWPDALLAMFISIFLGGLGAVFHLARSHPVSRIIPYGPYIAAATLIVMFLGGELASLWRG